MSYTNGFIKVEASSMNEINSYKYLVILPPVGQEIGWKTVISPAEYFEIEVRDDNDESVEFKTADTLEETLEIVKTYLEQFKKEIEPIVPEFQDCSNH